MAHAPAHAPTMIVTPMPRRSLFGDAAAVAGGVTVGTTMVWTLCTASSTVYTALLTS